MLIKGGDVLERINGITMIVFDKTGTLTAGQPEVKDLIDVIAKFKPARLQKEGHQPTEKAYSLKELLTILYLCEATSEHPLAKAIVKKVKQEYPEVEADAKFKLGNFKNVNGEGVVTNITYTNEDEQIGELNQT